MLAVLRAARAQALIDDLDEVVSDLASMSAVTAAGGSPASTHGSSGCSSGSCGPADGSAAAGSQANNMNGNSGGSAASPPADNRTCGSGNDDDRVRVPFALLWGALASRQEAPRVDALQLITTNPRTSSLPGEGISWADLLSVALGSSRATSRG